MKTKILESRVILYTDLVCTKSLEVSWYYNCQMIRYTEMKDGRWDGDWKYWDIDGILYWHSVYENGNLVKAIV